MMTITKTSFEKIYRAEKDVKAKKRMLLVLNVIYQYMITAAKVARDLHRSRTCACEWQKKYYKDGIDGLKNRPKSGKPLEIFEEVIYQIKKELKESKPQGWSTKQMDKLIVKKSGINIIILTYTASFVNGVSNRRCQGRYM